MPFSLRYSLPGRQQNLRIGDPLGGVRHPLYTAKFGSVLKTIGVESIKLPPRSPNCSAYIEQVIHTIKEEEIWSNQWDTLSEARQAIGSHATYYNEK